MSAPPRAPEHRRASTTASRRRRGLWWAIGGVVAVVAIALLAVLALGGGSSSKPSAPTNAIPGDPDNAGPEGTRGVTSIIRDHGVDVDVVHGLDQLRDRPRPGPGDTAVVSDRALTEANAPYLIGRFHDVHRLILLAPSDGVLESLGLPVSEASTIASTRAAAGCSLVGLSPDDVISTTGSGQGSYSTASTYATTQPSASCFQSDPLSTTGSRAAQLVVLPATASHPEIVVTDDTFFHNANLADDDNAGVAIRVLAPSDRLIWFIPEFGDRAPEPGEPDSDPSAQIPRWIGPGFLLAVCAVLALMLWRGRRFGPMVAEPLPAVVKAIETTQARGRLYHRAGADTRAAAILRIRTISRIAGYLGLHYDPVHALDALDASDDSDDSGVWTPDDSDASVAAIIQVTATTTRRDQRDVAALLTGPLPEGDDALVAFTTELTALEKEVRGTP
ncbi:DUF4350 domain-containing protein [Gordonia aichiensis]|uniref:DUF4350 domain-containing protein n=1 Tax=Gordonia aichiensis TaxID=36820 RepID=UPI00034D7DE3|nr:DUF4350 domain-containing protein [Gordonia aichiensis]